VTPSAPSSPAYGWQPPAPVPHAKFLGIARWIWLLAWLPLLPTALFALWLPAFVAPVLDTPLPLLCLLLLPLVNLGAGRASSGDTAPAVAVLLTTVAGYLFAQFGPLVVSLWRSASSG
jgi:hypothetical protein